MRALLMTVLALTAGCLRSTEYHCSDSAQCSGGVCESVGFCSFSDTSCPSGQRFGESAGSYANECVGDAIGDAGVDAPGDGPVSGCPASYAAVSGGQGNHVYRATMNSATWDAQRTACAADGANAYLAIPDDAGELMAINGLFMFSNTYWVGVGDAATEGVYLNVKGDPQTFLPWAGGQPNNNGDSDCVEVNRFDRTFNDTRCGGQNRAVCECEP
jgi:hypothetical protein